MATIKPLHGLLEIFMDMNWIAARQAAILRKLGKANEGVVGGVPFAGRWRNVNEHFIAFLGGRLSGMTVEDFMLLPGYPSDGPASPWWDRVDNLAPLTLWKWLSQANRVYLLTEKLQQQFLERGSLKAVQWEDFYLPFSVLAIGFPIPIAAGNATYDFLVVTRDERDPQKPDQKGTLAFHLLNGNTSTYQALDESMRRSVQTNISAGGVLLKSARSQLVRLMEVATGASQNLHARLLQEHGPVLLPTDNSSAWRITSDCRHVDDAPVKALAQAVHIAVALVAYLSRRKLGNRFVRRVEKEPSPSVQPSAVESIFDGSELFEVHSCFKDKKGKIPLKIIGTRRGTPKPPHRVPGYKRRPWGSDPNAKKTVTIESYNVHEEMMGEEPPGATVTIVDVDDDS